MDFLDRICQRNRDIDIDAEKLTNILKNENIPLLLWGYGYVADYVYDYLKNNLVNLSGVFFDINPPSNQFFYGFPVLSLEEACEKYRRFNIIVGHAMGYQRMDSLKAAVENINFVYAIEPAILFNDLVEEIEYDFVSKKRDLFEWTYNNLYDDYSKQSYIAYLNAKINRSYRDVARFMCANAYFPTDIMKITSSEVFVDCGAYTGDTIRAFLSLPPPHTRGCIYALEPDEANYAELLKLSDEIPNLYCFKKAVWNEKTTLHFHSSGTQESLILDDGETIIEADTIDNILNEDKATLIKMDIEGAELNALRGAEQTIRKYKPKLAICVYHKANDFITIPQYIKSLVPEYKLHFRAHRGTSDTVLYAICDC